MKKYFKTVIILVIVLSLIVPAVVKKLTTTDPLKDYEGFGDIFLIPTYTDNTPESFVFNLELPDLSTVSVEVTYSPETEMNLWKKTIIIKGLHDGIGSKDIKDRWFK